MKTPNRSNFKDNLEEFLREENNSKQKIESESRIM